MRIVADDAVELHRMVAVHRESEGCAEACAFLLVVIPHVIDRGASAHEITRIQRQPAAWCEGIGDACLKGDQRFQLARLTAEEIAVVRVESDAGSELDR